MTFEGLIKRRIEYNGDLRSLLVPALIVFLVVFFAATNLHLATKKKSALRKKSELESFSTLLAEYERFSGILKPLERKASGTHANVKLVKLITAIGSTVGIEGKLSAIPSSQRKSEKGFFRDGTMLTLTGITLNELVNFLYRIETHRNMLLVKNISMKPGPVAGGVKANKASPGGGLINVKISVDLVSKAGG